MSYVKENLSKGEKIIYTTSLHWILFFESAAIIAIGVSIFTLSSIYGGSAKRYLDYVGWGILLFGAGKFLIELIRHNSSEFGVTNMRVIIKTGVLSRTSMAMPLSKIESVEVEQSIWGRILDFGTIHITGTGTATSKFDWLSRPGTFRKKMQLVTGESEVSDDSDGLEGSDEPIKPQKRRLRRR